MHKHLFIVLFCIVAASCGQYPRDPEDSLNKARGRILRVGVSYTDDIRPGNSEPLGYEVELIKEFAKTIGATIQWVEGSEAEIVELLKEYNVHVAIAEFSSSSPYSKEVTFTKPYKTSQTRLFTTTGDGKPNIKKVRVYISEPVAAAYVLKEKGIPVYTDSLIAGYDYVASDEENLQRLKLLPTELILHEEKHVFAIPKGENAFLMELEKFIDRYGSQRK